MQQIKTLLFILFVFLLVKPVWTEAAPNKKAVLMVLSSHGQQNGQEAPGYEFDEFAKAYLVFKHNGLTVDIASPKGGVIEADKFDSKKPYNAEVLSDKAIMAKLNNTLSTAQINADEYQSVFIVGGKGAMFDLPKDTSLQAIIADIYQQQGTVAAVCHGPAALIDVQLNDGNYLVANKAVNSFTNLEEGIFGKKWLSEFEFMLEDKLVERGGKFQSSDIMLSHVAVDERLITGQNPSSTVAVANELVKSLGIKPKKLAQYRDDKTLALVAQILAGDNNAQQALLSNQQEYQIELIGMYGFYYLNVAETDQDLGNALILMTLAQEAINNPRLDMQIAKTQHRLGDSEAAASTLKQLLANKPDFEPALDLLKTL